MIKKMRQRLKNQKGMTLIELLAVIVILGIIAAIAIPSIGNIIAKSHYDAAKSDAIQVLNAANLYISSTGTKTATISQNGTTANPNPNPLEDYLDQILPENLTQYTVTIANGKATITATSNQPAKNGVNAIFKGTISDINKKEYATHTNPSS